MIMPWIGMVVGAAKQQHVLGHMCSGCLYTCCSVCVLCLSYDSLMLCSCACRLVWWAQFVETRLK
jgi:hypothetical protein